MPPQRDVTGTLRVWSSLLAHVQYVMREWKVASGVVIGPSHHVPGSNVLLEQESKLLYNASAGSLVIWHGVARLIN